MIKKESLKDGYYFELDTETNILTLKKEGNIDSGLSLDYESDIAAYKRQRLSVSQDLLGRALSLKKNQAVCDLTLGLGTDTLKLAYLGAQVTALESHPWIYKLVENALDRIKDTDIAKRINIKNQNSLDQIENLIKENDSFYLDPMYTHKRKSLPKKGMQYLADIVGESNDETYAPLIEKLKKHHKKLIIKRAPKAPSIGSTKPSRTITGKLVRFDVY